VVSLPDHLTPAPVGRARLPREVLEKHRRDRVLTAASGVFATRGFNSATVDDIVAAARIGVGSFYSLFGSKEECFLALYDRVVARARERVLAALPAGAPWPERFRTGLGLLLEDIAEDPDGARIVVVEAVAAGPAGETRYAATVEEIVGLLRGARALDRRGQALPASFERATVAGLAWLLYERLAAGDGERIDVEELLPEMVRIVLEPYG
jgi:AcrR family transcriptional regulator